MTPGPMRVLLLGGTGEARALADRLAESGVDVVSSLAGRVSRPALPVGDVRSGGFGGVEGLARYLDAEGISAVVDATHPFAQRISANAAAACSAAAVPVLRLQRPGWQRHPLADSFVWVDDADGARRAAEGRALRPFLTTGRQSLEAFAPWGDRYVLARVVDPPDWDVPASWDVLRARGPYTLEAERTLMDDCRVDAVITKDSGGALTEAKLQAAHDLGIPVFVIRRPPVAHAGDCAETVDDTVAWVLRRGRRGPQPGR